MCKDRFTFIFKCTYFQNILDTWFKNILDQIEFT